MKRSTKLFERLLDTDVKADLLTLFHNNAHLADTPEGLAKRIGRGPTEVQRELEDLVQLGILKKVEMFSFGIDRDKEIQDAISKQLALGQVIGPEGRALNFSGTMLQVPKISTGLDILDKALPEGIPSASTVLVLSDPGTGVENLVTHFVSQHIEAGKQVAYVTLDNFPPNIRQMVQARLEKSDVDWSSLIFIDCYSKAVGVDSDEFSTVDPDNLSAISIAISDIMSKSQISLIVLDSFNTLIRKRGGHSAIEFLRVLVARARQSKCLCMVTMNRKAFHPAIVASAQDVVDGVIELRLEEETEGMERSVRVLKMFATKHLNAWIPYDVSEDGELVQAEPKKPT
jgi:KaiC/GvpD/RAD55 family RecA-like ATPase